MSGSYTPGGTFSSNVASATTLSCQWIKVGSAVTVSGAVTLTPSSASVTVDYAFSLPFASNLSGGGQYLAGTCSRVLDSGAVFAGFHGGIYDAQMRFVSSPTAPASANAYFTFTYRIA